MINNTAAEVQRASGPRDISGSGLWDILKRTCSEAGEKNLGLIASGIAFNAFLAFVPLLTAVVLTYPSRGRSPRGSSLRTLRSFACWD